MNNVSSVSFRIDTNLKNQADALFAALGLNMTTAINLFLRTAIRKHGIPFDLKLDEPNETTIAAMKEAEQLLNDPNSPKYSNMDELKAALDL